MREMSQHTKVGAGVRIDRLLAFNQRLQQSQESSAVLRSWSLALDPDLVKIPARILEYPNIVFGNDRVYVLHIAFFYSY